METWASNRRVQSLSDCYFAYLSSSDCTKVMEAKKLREVEDKVSFLHTVSCFRNISLMLLRKLANLFKKEHVNLHQKLYQ